MNILVSWLITTLNPELLLSVSEVLPELQVSGISVNLQIPTDVAINTRLDIHVFRGNFDPDTGKRGGIDMAGKRS